MVAGVAALTVIAVLGIRASAASGPTPSACHAAELRFPTPMTQPISSAFTGYIVTIRNVGGRACVLRRYLVVRVPKQSPAEIDVRPVLTSDDLLPPIDFSRPLIVQPHRAASAYVVLTAPCGGVHSFAWLRLGIAAEVPYDQATRFFGTTMRISVCRSVANQITLPPLMDR